MFIFRIKMGCTCSKLMSLRAAGCAVWVDRVRDRTCQSFDKRCRKMLLEEKDVRSVYKEND